MEPKELKIIAEGMGYETHLHKSWPNTVLINVKNPDLVKYNPLTNDTQCMEIVEKLLKVHGTIKFEEYKSGDIGMVDNWRDDYALGKGKTINEAVCKAALEYFKREN